MSTIGDIDANLEVEIEEIRLVENVEGLVCQVAQLDNTSNSF